MKQLFVLFCLTIFSVSVSAMDINLTVTDSDGCKWKIVGEINFSWTGNVQNYDITATDCHGNSYHFSGIAYDPEGGATNLGDMKKYIDVISGDPIDEGGKLFIYKNVLNPYFKKYKKGK